MATIADLVRMAQARDLTGLFDNGVSQVTIAKKPGIGDTLHLDHRPSDWPADPKRGVTHELPWEDIAVGDLHLTYWPHDEIRAKEEAAAEGIEAMNRG